METGEGRRDVARRWGGEERRGAMRPPRLATGFRHSFSSPIFSKKISKMALLFQNPRKLKFNLKSLRKSQIIYPANTLISLSVESSTACGVGGWLVVHHSCPHPSYPAFVSKGYPSPSPYLPLVHSFEPPSGYYAPIFPLSKAIFNLFLLYPIVQYTSFLPPDFHVKVLPYS